MTAIRIFVTLTVLFILAVVLVSVYGWAVLNDLEEEQSTETTDVTETTPAPPTVVAHGLLGIALHPEFEENGFVYLTTSNRDGRGLSVPEDDRIIRVDPQMF